MKVVNLLATLLNLSVSVLGYSCGMRIRIRDGFLDGLKESLKIFLPVVYGVAISGLSGSESLTVAFKKKSMTVTNSNHSSISQVQSDASSNSTNNNHTGVSTSTLAVQTGGTSMFNQNGITPTGRPDRGNARTEAEAALVLGCTPSAMRKWRLLRTGPAYVRVGRLVRYRLVDLDAFIDANRVEPGARS